MQEFKNKQNRTQVLYYLPEATQAIVVNSGLWILILPKAFIFYK